MRGFYTVALLLAIVQNVWVAGPAAKADVPYPVPEFRNPQLEHAVIENNEEYVEMSICESFATLANGNLMCAYHRSTAVDWLGGYSTWTRVSSDGGKTWGAPQLVAASAQAPGILKLPSGDLLLNAAQMITDTSTTMRLFRSSNNGQSWVEQAPAWSSSAGIQLQGGSGTMTRLASGRILMPIMFGVAGNYDSSFQAGAYYSDNNGVSWQAAPGRVSLPMRGAMEPSVAELPDHTLLMALRTELGSVYLSRSTDSGQGWSTAWSSGLESPEVGPSIAAYPDGSGLLMLYDSGKYDPNDPGGHYGPRTPLTAAVSTDGGQTWRKIGDVVGGPHEIGPSGSDSIWFRADGKVLMGYDWNLIPWDRTIKTGGIGVAIGPSLASTPAGATRVWQGITNNDWAEANNWTWNWYGSVPIAVSPVQINNGTVQVAAGTNAVANGTLLTGGSLLVDGSLAGGCTVSGGTLGGAGAITGPVTVQSLGILSPGNSIGALTINSTLSLSGQIIVQINKTGSTLTADLVRGVTTLTYGGTLTVTGTGDAFAAGDTWDLFDAEAFAGSFTAYDLPTLGPGLSWDTSKLAVNGTIGVVLPEPGALVMLAVALLGSLPYAWRKRL